ncbi:hypothetical protein LJR289_005562 [Pseudoduganella sp. LjRoot289]|uniref:hypothetical protein n=1 Tax=Pseudoduganella sp. LjRoot289 TaxID=3342314 RepID=UPI003ECDD9BD
MFPNSLPVLLSFAALALAGCAPVPHRANVVPEIRGTLILGASPARNVAVLIGTSSEYSAPCKDAAVVTTTDEQGEFRIPSRQETELPYSLLNPPDTVRQLTNLCFQAQGKPVLFGGQFVTPRSTPSLLAVVCNPDLPKQRSPISVDQICR